MVPFIGHRTITPWTNKIEKFFTLSEYSIVVDIIGVYYIIPYP